MTGRGRRVLFWMLLGGLVAAAGVLALLRGRALAPFAAPPGIQPVAAKAAVGGEDVSLLIANDADGSLTPVLRNLPLPKDASTRASVLIQALLTAYADPQSSHPVGVPSSGAALHAAAESGATVFLMPLTSGAGKSDPGKEGAGKDDAGTSDAAKAATNGGARLVAVVNLSASFADRHPSGIETETLTLLSIIGTLHANLPQVAEVRFLVDGHPRETLAGHADLTRAYLASDSEVHP